MLEFVRSISGMRKRQFWWHWVRGGVGRREEGMVETGLKGRKKFSIKRKDDEGCQNPRRM